MEKPGCFQYCTFVVEFDVRDCDASRNSFIVQYCLGSWDFLPFYMKLSIVPLRSVKNFARILLTEFSVLSGPEVFKFQRNQTKATLIIN